jgi:RHS repeat-associated protein
MRQRSLVYHFFLFGPGSITVKAINLILVWALAFGSLPMYPAAQSKGTSLLRAEPWTLDRSVTTLPATMQSRHWSSPSVALPQTSRALAKAYLSPSSHRNPSDSTVVPFSSAGRGLGILTKAKPLLAMFQAVTNAAVKPVLECVVNNGGGSYTARFGYQNLNTVVVTVPVGANNKFTPNPIDRGQTTVFQTGRQRFVFDVPFNGSNLVWSLKGPDNQNRTSTASSNSAACATNHPPVANAGPAQTVFVGTAVQLDGSGSTDADGDPLTYRWSFVSIPAGSAATLTGSTTVNPTFVVDKPGNYTVQLIVNDGKVDSTPATVVISTKNSPPVANAGPNQTIATGATVQLNGSGSSDVDGDTLTYQWSFVSEPTGSAATLSNASIVNPTFVSDKKGTYVVQLVVNDGQANSTPSQVTISDINSPPVANPGPGQTVTTRTLVTLDGSGSTDVDGDPLIYTWAILHEPAGSAATLSDIHAVKPAFTVDVLGNYVIQLTVNDGTVNSTPATVTISDVNSPPVANAGPAQTVPLGSVVTLDGTGSSDVDGQSLSYSWSILSKPAGSAATLSLNTAPNPFFTADKAGNYVIQLIVNDGSVNSQPASVTVSTINSVPVANPGPNQTVTAGATVALDGSGSTDADGDPLTYAWAILSQPATGSAGLSNAHTVNPTFVASTAGLYVVQLIVNDGKVDSPPVTASITVNSANQPPIVSAGPNQGISLPVTLATLQGSAADDGLPVGGVLTSAWTQVSGPSATISSPASPVTTVVLTTVGTYVFRLTANDTQLSSSADTSVLLTPPNQRPVVNAGPSQTVTLPAAALLHGSASDDGLPFGSTLVTTWTLVAGPGTVAFNSPTTPVTQATFSAPGSYVLRLSASDTQYTVSSDVTVTVNPAITDTAPVVSAGPNQTVTFPATVTLNGSATSNNPLTIAWTKVDGPGTVSFANPASPITTATMDRPGTYILRLSASDSILSASSDVTVFVGKLACTRSNAGTDFWLMFPMILPSTSQTLEFFISADTSTTGTVTIPGLQFSAAFTVTPGQTTTVTLPSSATVTGQDVVESKGIHVTSLAPVRVYGLDFVQSETDGYTGLPTTALGTNYEVLTYQNLQVGGFISPGSEFGIVATQSGTNVTITPSQKTDAAGSGQFHAAGVPYHLQLNQGQTYQLQNNNLPGGDLTGTQITSDKPVAVFGAHKCAFVGGQLACNHLVEQMPPVNDWGKNFVTMPLATRNAGDILRYLASQDQTHVQVNGAIVATLNAHEVFEQSLSVPAEISADQPILVMQLSQGSGTDGNSNADPFMALVPSYDQFGGTFTVSTPATGFPTNYLNVVAPTAGLDGAISIDGTPVPGSSFVPVGKSGFSGAQVPVSIGSHHVAGTVPFGLTAYGYANFDGYGYYGGACYASAASGAQVTLSPKTLTAQVDSQNCFSVSTTDAGGAASGGIGVQLDITGVNPQSTFLTTDATGTANFCYAGANAGSDLIKASVGSVFDTASWTWTAAVTNHAPIVSAGPNVTISLPQNTVTLRGAVTDDGLPVGVPVTVFWTLVSGIANAVTISTPNQVSTQVTFQVPGVYVFQLTADDSQLSSSATVTVTVLPQNNAPSVGVGAPQTIYRLSANPSVVTTVQGTATDDGLPSGILNAQWSVFSGPAAVVFGTPTALTTTATFTTPGQYVLALTASDGQLSSTAYLPVRVLQNQRPVVNGGAAQTIVGSGGVVVTLSAVVTDDGLPLGGALTYQWFLARGAGNVSITSPNQPVTQVSVSNPGQYIFGLTVSDGLESSSGSTTITVVTSPPVVPPPPTVSIVSPADQAEITKPVPVTGSVSGGNWTLSYRLNTDQGAATTPFTTLATGTQPVSNGSLGTLDPGLLLNGLYTIQLTSTDSNGQTSSASVNVMVTRNRKLGFFTISFNDLSVPLPGLPIQIVRTYDSRQKDIPGDFGPGWTLSMATVRLQKNRSLTNFWEETVTTALLPTYCVQSDSNRFVTVTFPDGKVYKFQAQLTPQCQQIAPITGPTLSFAQLPGEAGTEGASLVPADGGQALIDGSVPGSFGLVGFNGTPYDPTTFNLTTAEGFIFTIDQGKGLLQVADPNGNTITINRNGLTHSSGKSVVFGRDSQGRITSITDPQGKAALYAYDPETGDLQSLTDRQLSSTFYGYAQTPTFPGHLLATISDDFHLSGSLLSNNYDTAGHLQNTTDGQRQTVAYNVQQASNQETITDRNGNASVYTYDDEGDVVAMVDPLGHEVDYSYDTAGNKLSESRTDDNGRKLTTAYAYDSHSNLTSQTDPLGNVTQYTYNPQRQVLTVIDPRGKLTQNSYDTKGNLLQTIDPLGNKSTYSYFSNGQPKTITDALQKSTSFVYDANGNLTQQTDALGNVTSYAYDASNNKTSQTVTRTKANGTQESLTTQYVYDANSRLIKTIYPDGSNTQTSYDNLGHPATTTNANNNVTTYVYDNDGRVSRITYPDQTVDSYTYDGEGRRLSQISHTSVSTSYTYDKVGRLLTTFFNGGTGSTAYDALGRVKSTTDQRTNTTTYAYDDAGQRISVTDPLNNVTHFAYDAAGNQTSMTDALTHTTQVVYDDAGRRIQTIYPDLTTDSVGYDAVGRQIAKTDQAGKVTQYGYDALGRLISVTKLCNTAAPGCGPATTTYAYDELGNRISQTDANGHITRFAYDQLGRRSGRTLPVGMSEAYAYDAAGNLSSRTDFNGHTTTYQYDNMNRLALKTADAFFSTGSCAPGSTGALTCGATQISYTYTRTGKRLSMTDSTGNWGYVYDFGDRLTARNHDTLRDLARSYTYDAAGNLLSLSGLQTTTYTYDSLNRLATAQPSSGVTSTYAYDAVGNLSGVQTDSLLATGYTYDTLNRLTNMQSSCGTGTPACAPGTPIASYAYTLGAAGNRLSVAELSGRTVTYGYDDLYRLTSETVSSDPRGNNGQVTYTFDNVGNRLQRNSTLPAVPATGLLNYDANDRTAADPYDSDGNLLSSGAGTNVYDFENRLVQAGGVSIVYDGDGNRVIETVAGVTTHYLVAELNPTGYAQVIEEHSGNGTLQRQYAWGLQLISARDFPSGTSHYYGLDGHGSVRFLTSSSGAITDTYDYDAFGNLIAQTGATPNNYLFAGEQFDPALGIYYNRARYYDQRAGRFWTMDTDEGASHDPISLHKYLYAGANPVDRLDPSGHDFIDVVAAMAVSSILTGGIGAVAGGIDRYLGGGNALQVADAARSGALSGLAFGALIPIPLLGAAVVGTFLGLTLVGTVKATLDNNYKLAAFRALMFVGGSLTVLRAGLPGEEPVNFGDSAVTRLLNAVDQAEQQTGPGSGSTYGIAVHTALANIVRSWQDPDFSAEVSYLNGGVVKYGTPGSVRVDVVYGPKNAPIAVYDLKTGNASLDFMRVQQIQAHLPGNSGVPVIELK